MSSTVCRARKTLPCQQNPLEPCQPCQPCGDAVGGRRRWGCAQALGELGQHGEAHRDVEGSASWETAEDMLTVDLAVTKVPPCGTFAPVLRMTQRRTLRPKPTARRTTQAGG